MTNANMSKMSTGPIARLSTVGLVPIGFIIVGLLAGCDSSDQSANSQSEAVQAEAVGSSAQESDRASAPSSQNASAQDDRYDVRSPGGAVAVGQKQKVELAITPGDGLKINKEFPWKLEFSPPTGVQLAQKKVAGAQIDLADSQATIPVLLEADTAGQHKLDARGDFSVCNDTKCYVIRDQALSFELDAEDANANEAAAKQAEEPADSPK